LKIRQFIKQTDGQSLSETLVALLVVIYIVLGLFQFSLFITGFLSTNYAAFRAGRAVLVSYNNERSYGQSAGSALMDARKVVGNLYLFSSIAGSMPYQVKLYKFDSSDDSYLGDPYQSSESLPADSDVWVEVTGRMRYVMPYARKIFGLFGWKTIKAYYLIHTPNPGRNNP